MKNNWMKRLLACTLAVLMIASVFTGCGKDADAEGVDKVVWWSTSTHNKTFLEEKTKEFNETIGKEIGLKLEYVFKSGDLDQMVDLAFETDQAPDFFTTWQTPARVQKGQIQAFNDIPGAEGLLEKFGANTLEGRHNYEGKTYTLPITGGTYGLVYNVDMFKAAGLVDEEGNAKPPVTWDEVVEYAKILTNPEKQEYGIVLPAKWGGFYTTDINMASSAINGMTDAYNPADGSFSYDAQVEVMDAYVRMKKDGSTLPGGESLDNDPARARFAQGGIGMKIAGSYDYGVWTNQFPAQCEWAVAPLPVVDANAPRGRQYSSADGLFQINSSTVERVGAEKVVAVLEFLTSDDYLREAFERGLSIPLDYSIIEDIEVPAEMANWKAFASLVPISKCPPLNIKYDITGEKSISDICIEILNEMPEKEEIAKRFADFKAIQTAGIAKYQKIHPEYDASLYIIPDWKLMVD